MTEGMHRRDFLKRVALGAIAAGVASTETTAGEYTDADTALRELTEALLQEKEAIDRLNAQLKDAMKNKDRELQAKLMEDLSARADRILKLLGEEK